MSVSHGPFMFGMCKTRRYESSISNGLSQFASKRTTSDLSLTEINYGNHYKIRRNLTGMTTPAILLPRQPPPLHPAAHNNKDGMVVVRTATQVHNQTSGCVSPRSSHSSYSPLLSPSPSGRHSPKIMTLPPAAIILGLWPHARQEQIDYYTQGYTALYPTAQIHILPYSRTSRSHVDTTLRALLDTHEKPSAPDTLIHLFGDDAAMHVCHLLRAHAVHAGRPLAVRAIVLDAVPIVVPPTLQSIRAAPYLLFTFLIHTVLACLWRLTSVLTLWFWEPYNTRVRRDLCDVSLVPAAARKCYIFPEKDVMFAWDSAPSTTPPLAIDEEASVATDEEMESKRPGLSRHASSNGTLQNGDDNAGLERQDFSVKRQFVGCHREQRWSGDQERYWLAIENAWEGR